MKIAAAQIKDRLNTKDNLNQHVRMIDLAAEENVTLLVFPEMSLTGYQRELAAQLYFTENDTRLNVFKDKAQIHQMLIIVGAPIKIDSSFHIGSFIFFPDRTVETYTKQFLHDGEEKYFTPSTKYDPVIKFNKETISIAICADINHPIHPLEASNKNTTLYIASLFYTPNGIAEGFNILSSYAGKYSMNVLMANYSGSSYTMQAAGQSGFWNTEGILIKKLDDLEENLLIVEI